MRTHDGVGLLVLSCLLLPAPAARADGGIFIERTAVSQEEAVSAGLVSSDGQRAAYVRWPDRAWDDWDLYIDPGTLAAGGAAWLLPLPAQPEVSAASPRFLDELDAATRPVLVDHITRTWIEVHDTGGDCAGGPICGGGGDAGSGPELVGTDDERSEATAGPVSRWESGRLGDAGYEVLSTLDAGALEDWLGRNGYVVPDGLAELAAPYVEAGYYFVAVRLVRADGDPQRLPTFRFRLRGADGGGPYPLRLTALSMGQRLEFTIFAAVFHEGGPYYLQPNRGTTSGSLVAEYGSPAFYERNLRLHDEEPESLTALYERRLERILAENGGRSMARIYAAVPTTEALLERVTALAAADPQLPLAADPEEWSPELQAILAEGMAVTRLFGRFPRAAMTEDLRFGGYTGGSPDPAYYERFVEIDYWDTPPPADAFDGASVAAGGGAGAPRWPGGLLLLALLVAPVITLRRRAG